MIKYIFTVTGITIRRERDEGKTDRQTDRQRHRQRTRGHVGKHVGNSKELRRLNRKNTTS